MHIQEKVQIGKKKKAKLEDFRKTNKNRKMTKISSNKVQVD